MATLEKIRSKSVLLFVIIIVALLAFILGDFLTSGKTYFGSGTTVAKNGDVKVEYEEYRRELESMQNQYQQAGQQVDNDELAQSVITSLLFKNMLKQHYEMLGLTVTDKEITNAMTGAMPAPAAQQFVYQVSQMLSLPQPDAQTVLDALNNPAKYNLTPDQANQLKAAWANIENNVNEELLFSKYNKLLNGLFVANDLDAKQTYDDISAQRNVAFISKAANTVPDADVKVTDEDIKAQWEKNKKRYALEGESRDVDYIYVEIAPSDADRMTAQKLVEDALAELNTVSGTGSLANKGNFSINNYNVPLSAVSQENLKEALRNDTVGHATLFDQQLDSYTLLKLNGKTTGIDSINISVLAMADANMADSLLAALNSGKAMTDLNSDKAQANDSVWASLIGGQFSPATLESLKTAQVGSYFFLNDTTAGQGAPAIFRVNKRNPEVTVYDFSLIGYAVDPSGETISDLNNKLNTFLSSNSNAADFSKHAMENGYSLLSAVVSAASPHVGDIPDSRQAVKWAMDNDKGKVSPIIRDSKQSYLMALAVKDVYDGDYKPYTASDINAELKQKAMAAKKVENLMNKYKGKGTTLEQYATAMEAPIDTMATAINSPLLLNLGAGEGSLQAKVATATKGQLTGPVAGNNYVLVFKVLEDKNAERPFDLREFGARFRQTVGIDNLAGQKLYNILKGNNKTENNSLNFIQSLDDQQ